VKALVLTAPNEFSIRDVPTPAPGRHEVLCRVRAVTICGTDAHLVAGDYPGFWPPEYPFIPGHEWAGEVVELGEGSAALGLAVGDRVAGTSHDACGFCQKCVEGRYNLCENYGNLDVHRQYGHNWQGAYAEYVVHGVKAVFPLPDELSFAEGAMLDPASIALHTANRGGIRPGDVVAALIDNESTLKTFVKEGRKTYLRAENPKYPDLVPAAELVIQGVVVSVLRRCR